LKNLIARRKSCLYLNFLTTLCTPKWCNSLLGGRGVNFFFLNRRRTFGFRTSSCNIKDGRNKQKTSFSALHLVLLVQFRQYLWKFLSLWSVFLSPVPSV
jgi:hypothetical protein